MHKITRTSPLQSSSSMCDKAIFIYFGKLLITVNEVESAYKIFLITVEIERVSL